VIYPLAVMRLGAPHTGHLTLIEQMLRDYPQQPALILIGSANLTGVPAAPLPWPQRQMLLELLLVAHHIEPTRLVMAPITDVDQPGFCSAWFEHLLASAVAVMGRAPGAYYFGDDYAPSDFQGLVALLPTLKLHQIHRQIPKSGTELRHALTSQDPALLQKYQAELAVYPLALQTVIRQICQV